MKIKSIFLISFLIILLSVFIFFLIPNSLAIFSFSGIKFFSGEIWRLLTFPFTHISTTHLFENVITIILVSLLAYEFGLTGKSFILFFLWAGFIVAIANAYIFPLLVIVGASLGTYGVLGALSIEGSKFIHKKYLIPLLGFSIFINYVLNFFSCPLCNNGLQQTLFHFSGFITGIFLFYIPRKFKKKKYVLNK